VTLQTGDVDQVLDGLDGKQSVEAGGRVAVVWLSSHHRPAVVEVPETSDSLSAQNTRQDRQDKQRGCHKEREGGATAHQRSWSSCHQSPQRSPDSRDGFRIVWLRRGRGISFSRQKEEHTESCLEISDVS
jgi:hypothetical protein